MIWAVMGKTVLTLSGHQREQCTPLLLITGYFQAMICLAGMGSFLLSLPALQSVTLILTMLIRKLSLSSAKAGQFLGFLQKKLCIYYHPFTRSEGKTLSLEESDWDSDCFLFVQDCHSCSHSSSLLIRHHLHHPRQLLRHGGTGHRVSQPHHNFILLLGAFILS